MKKKKDEAGTSMSTSTTDNTFTSSHAIPIPGHKRSRSFIESKSFSPSFTTPDMVVDAESATNNNVSFY